MTDSFLNLLYRTMKYFLVFVSVVLSSFVFAQDEVGNIGSDTSVLTEQLDMGRAYSNQINNVAMKFCNDWFESYKLTSKLDINMRPGQKKEICVVFVNQWSEVVDIVANIVPGSINDNGNIVCSNVGNLSTWLTVSDFEQFSGWMQIWAQKQFVKYFWFATDKLSSGDYYACLTINTSVSEKLSESSPFNLVVRKAGNIKINVSWSPYHFQWFDDILSLIEKNTRGIAIVGLIACGLLLISTIIPIFSKKNKKLSKKPMHKK